MRAHSTVTPAARPALSVSQSVELSSVFRDQVKRTYVPLVPLTRRPVPVTRYSENCASAFSDESIVCACEMCYCSLGNGTHCLGAVKKAVGCLKLATLLQLTHF